jgi:hypothetical protein
MLILIIILVLVLGGGGGYYGHSRWGLRWRCRHRARNYLTDPPRSLPAGHFQLIATEVQDVPTYIFYLSCEAGNFACSRLSSGGTGPVRPGPIREWTRVST